MRWFPANNDIGVCLHKTLWSPLLNSSTLLRQVCKGAHGIFCDFLWLTISSSLLEFYFLYTYTLLLLCWTQLSGTQEICTHSEICRFLSWSGSEEPWNRQREWLHSKEINISITVSEKFVLSYFSLMMYHVVCWPFTFASAQHPCVEQRHVKAALCLCNTKTMFAWVGTSCYCRKKLLLCSA